jgi:hypothetical protein
MLSWRFVLDDDFSDQRPHPEVRIDPLKLWTLQKRLQTSFSIQTAYSENELVSSVVNTEGPMDVRDSDTMETTKYRNMQTKSRISGL